MAIRFEELNDSHFQYIKEIYDYYVLNSTATYYTEKISIPELKEFIPVGNKKYQSFVIKSADEIIGFCYLSQYKKRQAYDRTAEVSVYLRWDFTGKGIGKLALEHLENIAWDQGIFVLVGIISADNENSTRLFEKCGYVNSGHLRQIGEKFGRVLDVVFYQKIKKNRR
jgi:L-amino acid N-acyltransferase YncA